MGAVFIGRPSAPVVIQHIAGEEGRLIRRALGAQTADCAGLVIDCLFGTGCSRLQILRLCFFSREAVCRHLAVFAAADRAASLVRAGRRAAVAILGFRMAGVTLTDSGVVFSSLFCVQAPPVVVQHIAGEEGCLIRRALGAQTADCAGLVIDCLFGTGCSRLQILRLCFFSCEAVCRHLAVFAAADRADGFCGAGCRAAVAILGFRMAGVTLTDSGVGLFHRCSASKRPSCGPAHCRRRRSPHPPCPRSSDRRLRRTCSRLPFPCRWRRISGTLHPRSPP